MEETKLSTINHLSTKSSVFHPTQLGAGGQQEIFRHMKRHYDRLGRVTAATDTSPPKSYKSSTLARDREKKHHVVDTFKLPVTSKYIEEHMRQSQQSELISLPTKDSDIQSLLQHVPELRKTIKFKPESDTSLCTNELKEIAETSEKEDTAKDGLDRSTLHSPRKDRTPDTSPPPVLNRSKSGNLNKNIMLGTTKHDMELKYLKFVSDMTREILTSSISSDRALNMLFERHVSLNKGDLNESIMRMRIEELKIKLNIKT